MAAAAVAAERQERCAPGPLLDRRLNVLLLHCDYDLAPHTTTKRDRPRFLFSSSSAYPRPSVVTLPTLATHLPTLQVFSVITLFGSPTTGFPSGPPSCQPTPYARSAAVQRHAHSGRAVHLFPTQFCKL